MIRFFNTLTGTTEDFKPINEKEVGMYNCGPTVYDYPHIGNLRSYVFADVLRRALESNGLSVKQVINITDIGHLSSDADDGEDKMTKGLKREGKPLTLDAMKEMANFYADAFVENLKALNIKLPAKMPKASDHIKEDVELIQKLESKGFIYTTSDGVYFDTSKFPDYGKLGGFVKKDEALQTRIGSNPEKKNPRDFAVWKFNKTLGFPSPWGQGFPGWHIECSVMSMKYLGETFDIHTGGIDHIPVHHNNEIAQSEAATGKQLSHFWLHNAHVIINSEKMSKSEGNYVQLKDLEKDGIDPLSYRFWLLTAHYRTQLNFTKEAIEGAQIGFKRLKTAVLNLGQKINTPNQKYLTDFYNFINDDLDTPKAIALIWDLLKDATISDADKKATIDKIDEVLGLGLSTLYREEIPQAILTLVQEREQARKNKDWKKSDELRSEINSKGFEVKDTDQGPLVSKK